MFHWRVTFETCGPTGARGTHTFVVLAASAFTARDQARALAESANAAGHRRGAELDVHGDAAVERWHGDALCRI